MKSYELARGDRDEKENMYAAGGDTAFWYTFFLPWTGGKFRTGKRTLYSAARP